MKPWTSMTACLMGCKPSTSTSTETSTSKSTLNPGLILKSAVIRNQTLVLTSCRHQKISVIFEKSRTVLVRGQVCYLRQVLNPLATTTTITFTLAKPLTPRRRQLHWPSSEPSSEPKPRLKPKAKSIPRGKARPSSALLFNWHNILLYVFQAN